VIDVRRHFPVLLTALLILAARCGPPPGGGGTTPAGKNPVVESGGGEASGNLPDITLERVDGQGTVRLHTLAKDKVVIVVFWSTFCDSCKSELVALKTLYGEYEAKGLEVLAVSMDKPDTASDVLSDVHKYSLPYVVAFDTESRASGSLNPTNAQPFTVVIDREMNIVFTHESYLPGDLDRIKEVVLGALEP
jgi:peroxiredoxin